MKKYFALLGAVITLFQVNSQQVYSFEEYALAVESNEHGANLVDGFTFENLNLSNYYYAPWDYWEGFAVSNMTDVTTAGYLNQYSAFTGAGSNSTNYAVYYQSGNLSLVDDNVQLTSIKVTNTTYAALAMRDGDAYSKQFGSIYNADGEVDGTNGEDYFLLKIIGFDNGAEVDTVEFYLADYRFANPMDDYIVDTWETVDLSVFPVGIDSLHFELESTDNGSFGMNTPNYFAFDELITSEVLGLEQSKLAKIELFPNPVKNNLFVHGFEGSYLLYDIKGEKIAGGSLIADASISTAALKSGVYFVEFSTDGEVQRLRFVKE